MQPVVTVEQMREIDARAQASGTPLERLIERAGTAVAHEAVRLLGGAYGRHVIVIAGPGNNGADGRLAAELLERRGARVRVLDARALPDRIAPCDLVIDAAFGTGFRGEFRAPEVAGVPVLAVDVPSGLDAMTGEERGRVLRAAATVTFGALKPGLLLAGRGRTGRIVVEPIGLPVPEAAECDIRLVTDEDLGLLPHRPDEAHKWTTAVAVVAGSPGMYGAPLFVSHAASRAGAGMVRLGIPGAEGAELPISEAVARALPAVGFDEVVLDGLERCKVLVLGPGLGTERRAREAVRRLVRKAPVPVVVDADGLSALGDGDAAAEIIAAREHPTVLTPHDGEFARLAGRPPGTDRIAAVRRFAASTGAIVLLKGSLTIVGEPNGRVTCSTSGSSRLATAGTGDVLSGVIGAFIARSMEPADAAALAAHVHGRAAERGRAEGLVASDLPELIADVLSGVA
jgi:NAD(P)H-hydrate epimerase